MTISGADVQPTGWLFTRGDASVSMTVEEHASGTVLLLRGPGTASAIYDFPDRKALRDFAAMQVERLQQEGFQLQAIAERRSSQDDRDQESRRSLPDRRRR